MPETNYNISGTLRLKGGQEFQRDLKSKLEGVKNQFSSLNGLIAGLGLGLLAKKMLDSAAIQEQAGAKIDAALKSTQGAAGLTREELDKMAGSLQKVGVVGDEVVMQGQAILLTFKNISRDIFPDVTEAVVDMTLAMQRAGDGNVNVKDTAIQVGKALNDPLTGLTALTRVGVTFTDQQKDMIKNLVEGGNAIEAQRMILAELKSEFGGMNRELAKTDSGRLKQVNNLLGDLLEKGGKLIMTFFRPVISLLNPILTFLNEAPQGVQNLIGAVGASTLVLRGLAATLGLLQVSIGPAGWVMLGVTALTTAFGFLSRATKISKSEIRDYAAEVNKLNMQEAIKQEQELQKQLDELREKEKKPREVTPAEIDKASWAELEQWKKEQDSLYMARFAEIAELEGRLKALREHMATLINQGKALTQQTQEMTDEEKDLLQNKMEFEFESHKISRGAYLTYLQQRVKDFQEFSDEWISLQKEITRVEQIEDEKRLENVNTNMQVQGEARFTWWKNLIDKVGEEKDKLQVSFEEEQQLFLDSFYLIGDAAAWMGQAFIEGLQGRVDSWKQFLKNILVATLEMLEQYMVLAKLKTILDGVINPLAALRDSWKLVMAFAAFEAAKAGVAAYEFGGIVTRPTLALVGEAGQPEIIAPQRDFMSYSRQLINEALAGAGSRNVRGGDVVINQQFNSPLTDRRQARKLTNDVLVPEMRRENKRSQRFLNRSVA